MGRKREFMRAAAVTAAPGPPPAARIATAVNCADPAKTMTDIVTAATAENPTSRASTPNEVDSSSPASANGTPSRTPARNDVRGSGVSDCTGPA